MQRWATERERPRRRPGQPSFSSTLLDAICDSLDDQTGGPGATAERAAPRAAGSAKKQQEAALHRYYYYKPALAASHRAAPSPADECSGSGRGYFSSSEVEYSLRRLRPIRTSGGAGAASVAPAEKQRRQPQAPDKARKPSAASAGGGCRRPASPGARLASLLNAIFSGKRHSARQHPAPADEEPAYSTAPSSARPCPAKTPPSARARASRSRSRTVRFLDIDGEVAVAAAAAGCRRFPVVEVEGSDGGEESSDASSDLFELENLAAVAPANRRSGCRRACGDELPVYGTTGAGLRHDVGRRRPFGHGGLALDRSFRW
ncbi:hypothetical protein BS78_K229300 [Paspalum vaginatum]|uniref:Protein BIG GRAIN 1-like n=1 Tax=Paspalum vaginatum TaxID=158149 RepID=A0A9W7XEG2_9POAL|nr:hypothetical protein BS78_K229300 [Paspalum vaginatum]